MNDELCRHGLDDCWRCNWPSPSSNQEGENVTKQTSSADAPPVHAQGKCVVERDGDQVLVMFPDGSVCGRPDARAAEVVIKRWFKARAIDAINVGLTEWRDGLRPPSMESKS